MLAGLVIVGACRGGIASNVICYLARADVALSITLTSLSNLVAVLATPVLVWLYVGESIPVPVAALSRALFSVWHNLSGSMLAGYWRRRSEHGD